MLATLPRTPDADSCLRAISHAMRDTRMTSTPSEEAISSTACLLSTPVEPSCVSSCRASCSRCTRRSQVAASTLPRSEDHATDDSSSCTIVPGYISRRSTWPAMTLLE